MPAPAANTAASPPVLPPEKLGVGRLQDRSSGERGNAFGIAEPRLCLASEPHFHGQTSNRRRRPTPC